MMTIGLQQYFFISVDESFLTFEPPIKSDSGSYWCRSKANHSNMAEGKLMYRGNCTVNWCNRSRSYYLAFIFKVYMYAYHCWQ